MTQANQRHESDHPDEQGLDPSATPIRAEHRGKLAVIYVRQSTPAHHTESTEAQRALADLPRQWGWSGSSIMVIEDPGFPGASSAQRPGFHRLLEMMDRGEVGIVLVRDLARLSRDAADLELFLRNAMRHGVLIGIDGKVSDVAAPNFPELFGLRTVRLGALGS